MENRQEATVQRPLQAVIRSEYALYLYERSFPAKTNRPGQLILGTRWSALETLFGAQPMTTTSARFDRTTATRKWGVSDPLGAAPWAKKGAAK